MSLLDKIFKNKKYENVDRSINTSEKVLANKKNRGPYPIQIGIDFGTSSIKCIFRNLADEKAKIYYPNNSLQEFPFLFSTDVYK